MAEQDMQRIGMTEDDLAMQERRAKRSDQAAVFASWLNSMRMKPDENLPAQLQAAQERRASNIRKNRTVNMLESAGQTELAKQVKSGAITGKTAVAQMFLQRIWPSCSPAGTQWLHGRRPSNSPAKVCKG